MRKFLLLFLPVFLGAFLLFHIVPASAQYGLDITAGKAGYNKSDTPESIATSVINTALALVFIAFFILVLYAGIRWMAAQGNEEHVTKAKNILEAAIIGLVVISAAYAITNFVLGRVGTPAPVPNSTPVPNSVPAPVTCSSRGGTCEQGICGIGKTRIDEATDCGIGDSCCTTIGS